MDTCNRLMDEILRTDGHQASCVRVRGLRSSSNNWYAAQTVSGMRGRVWATSFPLDSLEDPFCVVATRELSDVHTWSASPARLCRRMVMRPGVRVHLAPVRLSALILQPLCQAVSNPQGGSGYVLFGYCSCDCRLCRG